MKTGKPFQDIKGGSGAFEDTAAHIREAATGYGDKIALWIKITLT